MKKVSLVTLGLLVAGIVFQPVRAQANEYCYDQAIFAVERARDALRGCGVELRLSAFDPVINRLSGNGWSYNKKVVQAMAKLSRFYEGKLEPLRRENACVKAVYGDFNNLKAAVMDGLISCI